MFNSKTLDELAARIGKAIENSPAKDIEKNVKAMLQSGLAKLDVVPRSEFDTQAQVLLKTREKLEQLETRLAEIEARSPERAYAKVLQSVECFELRKCHCSFVASVSDDLRHLSFSQKVVCRRMQ